jgi:hypothetical protein
MEIAISTPPSALLLLEEHVLVADFNFTVNAYGLGTGLYSHTIVHDDYATDTATEDSTTTGGAVGDPPVDRKNKTLRDLFERKISDLKVDGELLFVSSSSGLSAYLRYDTKQSEPNLLFYDESPAHALDIANDKIFSLVNETEAKEDEETAAIRDKYLLIWPAKVYSNLKASAAATRMSSAPKRSFGDLEMSSEASMSVSSSRMSSTTKRGIEDFSEGMADSTASHHF